MMLKDYYGILGVSSDASEEEIKKAYRRLAKQYHPDRNQGRSSNEERLKEINEAYQVLGNKEKRRLYDLQFKQANENYVFLEGERIEDFIGLLWKLSQSGLYKIRTGGCRKRGLGRGCRGGRRFFFEHPFE